MSTRMVLTLAFAVLGWREQGGDNHGQVVNYWQQFAGIRDGDPWCAAFVSWVGYHGCYDYLTGKSYWPLVKTGGCQPLYEDARAKGIVFEQPQAGDVFVIYFPSKGRFAHTGFVVAVNADGSCVTVEGNTNDGGSREGYGVFKRTRHFGPNDRFLRFKLQLPAMRTDTT